MPPLALVDADTEPRVKKMGLRKLRFSRSANSDASASSASSSKGVKYSKSVPSLSTLVQDVELLSPRSNDDMMILGCLKVRTHEDSLQRNYKCGLVEQQQDAKQVGFSTVEVRSHPMILGDNPSVSSGFPVTIDWKPQDVLECDLTHYEQVKPLRRSRSEIALPARLREAWIMDQGYARSELADASREVEKIKKNRNATVRKVMRPPSFFSFRRRGST